MKDKKLEEAVNNLKEALSERDAEGPSAINDAGVSKCFEVALEYSWKAIKRRVESDGLEAVSPKDAIKVGASVGLIDSPKEWIEFINNRNLAVHDYLGVDDAQFLKSIRDFVLKVSTLLERL